MRILVVEDEVGLSDALGRGLRHAAHAVDVAPTLARLAGVSLGETTGRVIPELCVR